MIHPSSSRFLPASAAAVALSCLVFLAVGSAQDRAARRPLKVGCVDLSRVFKKYPLTRKLARELREWKNTQEALITEKEKTLAVARDELVTAQGGMAKDAHKSLVDTNTALGGLRGKTHGEYSKRLLQNDRTVYAKIRAAVTAITKEEGLDITLQILDDDISADTPQQQGVNIRARTVLSAADDLDITDLVLDRLEEEMEEDAQ